MVATGTWEPVKVLEADGWVTTCAFSPDGSLLAYGVGDKKLTVVATGTWEPVKVLEVEADGGVATCAFSPDGSLLAYGGQDKKLTVVATGTWEPVKVLEADDWVRTCAFSPDGSLLLLDRRSFSVSFFSFRLRGSRLVVVEVAPPNLAPKRCTQGVVALPVFAYTQGRPWVYARSGSATSLCVHPGAPRTRRRFLSKTRRTDRRVRGAPRCTQRLVALPLLAYTVLVPDWEGQLPPQPTATREP